MQYQWLSLPIVLAEPFISPKLVSDSVKLYRKRKRVHSGLSLDVSRDRMWDEFQRFWALRSLFGSQSSRSHHFSSFWALPSFSHLAPHQLPRCDKPALRASPAQPARPASPAQPASGDLSLPDRPSLLFLPMPGRSASSGTLDYRRRAIQPQSSDGAMLPHLLEQMDSPCEINSCHHTS